MKPTGFRLFRGSGGIYIIAAFSIGVLTGFPWNSRDTIRNQEISFICRNSFGSRAQEQSIKDDLGRSFSIARPPRRIVSLAPNITEVLFALGLGEKVVGVTRFCDYPPAALEKEKIGGLIDPSLEKIKALAPDLIIAFRGNPVRVINRLEKLKFPVFVLDIGTSLESLFPMVRKLGMLTHTEKEAERVDGELREQLGRIQARLGPISQEPKVFLSLHGPGLWTCGKESYLTDLLRLAGARNVAGAIAKKWLNYNREQLLQDDPDVILIMTRSEADFERDRSWFSREAHLESVRAVKTGRIYRLDENVASRFGPRLLEALGAMARLLHPDSGSDLHFSLSGNFLFSAELFMDYGDGIPRCRVERAGTAPWCLVESGDLTPW